MVVFQEIGIRRVVGETLEGMKGRLKAWNRNLISQRIKTKLNINPVLNVIKTFEKHPTLEK